MTDNECLTTTHRKQMGGFEKIHARFVKDRLPEHGFSTNSLLSQTILQL